MTTRREGEDSVIEIAGRLMQDGVAELLTLTRAATGSVSLDLRDLRFADSAGLRSLRELRAAGATLRGTTPYISLLLAAETEDAPIEKTEGKKR